jgi:hypothetical protein
MLSVYVNSRPPINFWMPELIFTKLRIYIMASERSCLCMCISLGNGSVRTLRLYRRIVARVVFFAVSVVSKESMWVCLCIPLSLLGNGLVNDFPRPRGIAGGVVFYANCFVPKRRRQLILPRTSCIYHYVSQVLSSIPVQLLNFLFICHLLHVLPICHPF